MSNNVNHLKNHSKTKKKVSFNNQPPEVRNNIVIPEGLYGKKRDEYYKVERSKRQGDWASNQFTSNSLRDIEGDLHNAPFERFPSRVLRKIQPYNYKSSTKKMTPARLDKLRNESSYNINSMIAKFKESQNNENKILNYKQTIESKKRRAMRILDVISRKSNNYNNGNENKNGKENKK
jgi:hypothetical protein